MVAAVLSHIGSTPGSPLAIMGDLIGNAVKPYLSTAVISLASSVSTVLSSTAIDNTTQNANQNAAAFASTSTLGIQPQKSFMSIFSMRKVVSGPHMNAQPAFSVVTFDCDRGQATETDDFLLFSYITGLKGDLIALQSFTVKQFVKLQIHMAAIGYEGIIVPRTGSQNLECIFVNVDRFIVLRPMAVTLSQLIEEQANSVDIQFTQNLKNGVASEIALLGTKLVCRISGKGLLFLTARLTPLNAKREDLQTMQTCAVLKFCESEVSSAPFVFAGNLNFSSTDKAYQVMKDGYPDDGSKEVFNRQLVCPYKGANPLLAAYEGGFSHPIDELDSTYSELQRAEAQSFYDETIGAMRESSYVLHDSGKTDAVSILEMPSQSVVGRTLPNEKMPSLHLALKSWLTFKA